MITSNKTVRYRIEWRGTGGGKSWIFTDLKSAKEIYAEKDSEGKKPKLFMVKETITIESTRVKV